jgi:hypothetical protein
MSRNPNYYLDDLLAINLSLGTLFYPPDLLTNSYWESDIGHFYLLYTEHVFEGFIRKLFDKSYQGRVKMPRQPKEARYQIEAEADLWVSVWKMIKKIDDYFGEKSITNHPALCLYILAIEASLILPTVYDERVLDDKKVFVNKKKKKELGQNSTTRLVRIIQQQNRELKNLEGNPFDECKTFTYQLINDAISLAHQSDSFRKQEWRAMVRSREKLVTVLREGELSNGVTVEHRGRAKRVSK